MTKNKVQPLSYQEDKVHPFVHHEEENNNEDICFVKIFEGMEIFLKNSLIFKMSLMIYQASSALISASLLKKPRRSRRRPAAGGRRRCRGLCWRGVAGLGLVHSFGPGLDH